jgi:SAM-dependent methyltransferase
VSQNIAYQTDQLASYFSRNRITWSQFYESERVIIGQLHLDPRHAVLDIGCGCGGLGLALRERYGVENYTGVEINALAAEAGRRMNPTARILCGDILELNRHELRERHFDVVFSLSCVDWNVQFADMLAAAWSHVRPGGCLVATFRLTDAQGCNDMQRSYQYINYEGIAEGERACYVVLNAQELLQELSSLDPSAIDAYGYWGTPSKTAVTPYQRLCFAAFSIRKRSGDADLLSYRLKLPAEIHDLLRLPPHD